MFWTHFYTFIDIWRFSQQRKNGRWHKTGCWNVLPDFLFEVKCAIYWQFLPAAASNLDSWSQRKEFLLQNCGQWTCNFWPIFFLVWFFKNLFTQYTSFKQLKQPFPIRKFFWHDLNMFIDLLGLVITNKAK